MITLHPTLLIGPSDWQPAHMPQDVFAGRLDALWQRFPQASHALVYGDSRRHAELAYFSNFVPKLEAAVALLSREQPPRLFVGGGANMLDAARPLTWITDLAPLKALEPIGLPDGLLVASGNAPLALRRIMTEVAGQGAPDVTAQVWSQMACKSEPEIAAIRAAAALVGGAVDAMRDALPRASATDIVLTGEHAAYQHGAQDVRMLFSLDGGRTLRPFTRLIRERVDTLQIYVAVRRFNYWSEAFVLLSEEPAPAANKASEVLRLAVDIVRPGVSVSDVEGRVAAAIMSPYHRHPVTKDQLLQPIGLALDLACGKPEISAGEVYSLRIGLTDRRDQHAIASAMILMRDQSNELLWSTSMEV